MVALIVPAVTPSAPENSELSIGGTSVLAFLGGAAGGVIQNPPNATEPLFVNPIGPAGLEENGTTFKLLAGESWEVVPEQTNSTYVNAASSGHAFSAVQWGIAVPLTGPDFDLTNPDAIPFVPVLLAGI